MYILRLCHRKESTVSPKNSDKQSVLIPPLKEKIPGNITAASEKRNNNPYYTFNPKKMKKIFTLCSLVTLSFFANAQINENFENGLAPLEANCWQFVSMMHAATPSPYVINGNGSAYSEPPVSSDSLRIMRTPYLDFGTSIDVSFVYRISGNLNGQASRFIKLDLVNSAGVIVQTLDSFSISNAATTSTLYSQTIAVNIPGQYRFSLTLGGKTGGGSVRTSIDDLNVNAPVIGCVEISKLLPVHLISFQGNMNKNNKVTLNWAVADNETANSFEVERSFNGRDFTTVGVVFASEKMGTENYMFYETTTGTDKVMYRLKMIDKNREVDYSRILIFQLKSTIANNIKIIGNPVNDKLTFSYTSSATQSVDVKVYDISGKVVLKNKVNSLEGSNVISLPLSSTFTPGMYIVEVNNGTELQSSKFIKQ
jgi:Secretion system C-terminal sorting domain